MLQEAQEQFRRSANTLGDYSILTKTELANGYCDAEEAGDEILRSAYFSALMLRYWYKIYEWKRDSASLHLEEDDFIGWLSESLRIAFVYRNWRYEYKAIVSLKNNGEFLGWELDENGNKIPNPYYWKVDPNAPDKIINRCCFSTRGREYQFHNKDKRRANVTVYSMDSMVDENGDCALDYAGAVENISITNGAFELIHRFLNDGRMLEAVILDGIVNHDSFKEDKSYHYEYDTDEETGEEIKEKVCDYSTEFDPRKLVKHLNSINQDFMQNYFCNEYDITDIEGNAILEKLNKTSNSKLYKYIQKTLIQIRETPELLNYLIG